MILTEVEKREKSLNFKSKKIKILEVDHTAPSFHSTSSDFGT